MKFRHDKQPRGRVPFLRSGTITTAIMLIAGGVTFAALQSQQAKLTGNSIQTATANLQVSSDGVTYASSQAGFAFGAIIPGGQASPADGYPVFLKNGGGTPLSLKLGVSSSPTKPDNVDLTKVHVMLAPTGGGSVQNFKLQALIAGNASGGLPILSPAQLLPGATAGYKLQISMESDAMNGPSATINNLDFSFSGSTLSP